MAGLTSLRGIAALWVVCYHFDEFMPSTLPSVVRSLFEVGYLGVDLFFIMSGFIISYVHWDDFKTLEKNPFLVFMVKRIARIYPLHLLMLVMYITIPIAILNLSSAGIASGTYTASSFVANLFLVQATGVVSSPGWNFPSWSISVEFFSYLLFPLIAWMGSKLKGFHFDFFFFLLSLLAVALVFLVSGYDSLNVLVGLALVRGVLEFCAGCFLFKMFQAGHNRAVVAVTLTSLVAISAAIYVWPNDYVYWPALSAVIVLIAAYNSGPQYHLLKVSVLVYLGDISYSLYMSHAYIRQIFKFVFVDESGVLGWGYITLYFATLLVASIALYHVFEKPLRHKVRRNGERWVHSTGATARVS